MSHSGRPVHEVKANLFRVLGHPARVRILELLRDGERSVGALQKELGLDSGGTSQHLAALRRIGLVESRREGTSVYYRVEYERVAADWPFVRLIDAADAVGGPNGEWVSQLPDADGRLYYVRVPDTVHLAEHGQRLLAREIAPVVRAATED